MGKRSFAILGVFLTLVIVFVVVRSGVQSSRRAGQPMLPIAELTIGGATLRVEVADDPGEQVHGLSDRPSLGSDMGMLFVFPESGNHTFWMKNMRFTLDLVWIKGGTVVGVTENAPPEGESPKLIYGPPEPVDKVLEVDAGIVAKYRIKAGDRVEMSSE